MATLVRVDMFYVYSAERRDLIARTCSITGRYGQACLMYASRYGDLQVCPYLYGLAARSEWHTMEGRSMKEMRDILATHEGNTPPRTYTVMCLAGSNEVLPGADAIR